MHADVLEADLLLDHGELLLPVGPQALVGAPRADRLLEHLRQRAAYDVVIGLNDAWRGVVVGSPCSRRYQTQPAEHTGLNKLPPSHQITRVHPTESAP